MHGWMDGHPSTFRYQQSISTVDIDDDDDKQASKRVEHFSSFLLFFRNIARDIAMHSRADLNRERACNELID